jgi:hypothetical protein
MIVSIADKGGEDEKFIIWGEISKYTFALKNIWLIFNHIFVYYIIFFIFVLLTEREYDNVSG